MFSHYVASCTCLKSPTKETNMTVKYIALLFNNVKVPEGKAFIKIK